nr:transcription elongation factor GreA [Geodermatophilaceae bacterium]
MSTTEHQATASAWLTQEAHDLLRVELDRLIGSRTEISAEINARREEGDLKENGGYHAAKEEQGRQELRILQLQALLREATVGNAPVSAGVAGPGMVVEVRFGDSSGGDVETFLIGSREETERFLLGSREIGATTELTVYSPDSAMGTAITGRGPGDSVT